jgi:hypothetical protein
MESPLEQPRFYGLNHGEYSMYGIDFPRAFGLAWPNIPKN